MPNTIAVELDEMEFTSDQDTSLVTKGVTTCIAFIVCGVDEHNEKFCALYHWSGFPVDFKGNPQFYIQSLLEDFFDMLIDIQCHNKDSVLTISQLACIGGEHAAYDDEGNLTLSGTEREVETLIGVMKKIKTNQLELNDQLKINPGAIKHYHYLTKGSQDISISVDVNAYNYTIHEEEEEDEVPLKRTVSTGLFKEAIVSPSKRLKSSSPVIVMP